VTMAYEDYRDANSRWVDRIPAHWRIERLKFVARPQASNVDKHSKDDEIPVRLCNYTDVYNNAQIIADMDFMEATATQAEIDKFALTDDEVIITKDSESWQDIAVPAHVPNAIEGVLCGYHLTQIRPDQEQLDGRYLYYQLCSAALNRQFQVKANGVTRFGLPAYHIDNAETVIPPIDEQRKIARFLDHKLGQIQALIEKKTKLLEQMEEQRSSVITRAVTEGVDHPDAYRETGFAWLPKVPASWSFKRLRFLLREPLMYGANEAAEFEEPDWPRFIRITDVHANGTLRPETFKSLPPEVAAPYKLVAGDILLARSGATVGKSFKYDDSWGAAAFAGYLIRARFEPEFADFLTWYLRSQPYWEWVKGNFIQATIQNISAEKYSNLWVPVPPKAEREHIVAHIETEMEQIERVRQSIDKAIVCLAEYKASIITAAVTGQIKVV